MTPKDKAIELHENFWSVYYADLAEDFTYKYISDISKKCALICVDEIVNTKSLKNRSCGYITLNERHIEFWNEVKQEIEKL